MQALQIINGNRPEAMHGVFQEVPNYEIEAKIPLKLSVTPNDIQAVRGLLLSANLSLVHPGVFSFKTTIRKFSKYSGKKIQISTYENGKNTLKTKLKEATVGDVKCYKEEKINLSDGVIARADLEKIVSDKLGINTGPIAKEHQREKLSTWVLSKSSGRYYSVSFKFFKSTNGAEKKQLEIEYQGSSKESSGSLPLEQRKASIMAEIAGFLKILEKWHGIESRS